MRSLGARPLLALLAFAFILTSCATSSGRYDNDNYASAENVSAPPPPADYTSRLPQTIASNEKTVVVDPNVHAWGAYQNGQLVKAGLATAGGNWCSDIGRSCRTGSGSFRIKSLGSPSCKSSLYPLPRGGAPMPYCMFFNGSQGLHGSSEVVEANVSHGCVRMQVQDAEWLRYNFASIGTRVVVKQY